MNKFTGHIFVILLMIIKYSNGEVLPNHRKITTRGEFVKYDYKYGIVDDDSGSKYGHSEVRDGFQTKGKYFVYLPDGRVQTVSYYADEHGYHPTITYDGPGNHNPPSVKVGSAASKKDFKNHQDRVSPHRASKDYSPAQSYSSPRDHNRSGDHNRPGDYNRPKEQNRPGEQNRPEQNRPREQNRPGDYNTPKDYNPPQRYSPSRDHTRPGDHNPPRAHNSPQNYSPPRNHNPPRDYNRPKDYSPIEKSPSLTPSYEPGDPKGNRGNHNSFFTAPTNPPHKKAPFTRPPQTPFRPALFIATPKPNFSSASTDERNHQSPSGKPINHFSHDNSRTGFKKELKRIPPVPQTSYKERTKTTFKPKVKIPFTRPEYSSNIRPTYQPSTTRKPNFSNPFSSNLRTYNIAKQSSKRPSSKQTRVSLQEFAQPNSPPRSRHQPSHFKASSPTNHVPARPSYDQSFNNNEKETPRPSHPHFQTSSIIKPAFESLKNSPPTKSSFSSKAISNDNKFKPAYARPFNKPQFQTNLLNKTPLVKEKSKAPFASHYPVNPPALSHYIPSSTPFPAYQSTTPAVIYKSKGSSSTYFSPTPSPAAYGTKTSNSVRNPQHISTHASYFPKSLSSPHSYTPTAASYQFPTSVPSNSFHSSEKPNHPHSIQRVPTFNTHRLRNPTLTPSNHVYYTPKSAPSYSTSNSHGPFPTPKSPPSYSTLNSRRKTPTPRPFPSNTYSQVTPTPNYGTNLRPLPPITNGPPQPDHGPSPHDRLPHIPTVGVPPGNDHLDASAVPRVVPVPIPIEDADFEVANPSGGGAFSSKRGKSFRRREKEREEKMDIQLDKDYDDEDDYNDEDYI